MRFFSRLCLVLAALMLAACQQLPRPYQPDNKSSLEFAALTQQSVIVLTSFEGQVPPQQDLLLHAVEAEMLSQGLDVVRQRSGPLNNLLLADARVLPKDGEEEIILRWELVDAQGQRLALHRQNFRLPAGLWQRGLPELYPDLAEEAGREIAFQVLGPPVREAKLPGLAAGRLVVGSISGAPGDGGRALEKALVRQINQEGLPLASEAQVGDIVIDCEIRKTPLDDANEVIELVWITSKLEQQGEEITLRELGRIRQSNALPLGALDGEWGHTANLIAQGTLSGVLDLLAQLANS